MGQGCSSDRVKRLTFIEPILSRVIATTCTKENNRSARRIHGRKSSKRFHKESCRRTHYYKTCDCDDELTLCGASENARAQRWVTDRCFCFQS